MNNKDLKKVYSAYFVVDSNTLWCLDSMDGSLLRVDLNTSKAELILQGSYLYEMGSILASKLLLWRDWLVICPLIDNYPFIFFDTVNSAVDRRIICKDEAEIADAVIMDDKLYIAYVNSVDGIGVYDLIGQKYERIDIEEGSNDSVVWNFIESEGELFFHLRNGENVYKIANNRIDKEDIGWKKDKYIVCAEKEKDDWYIVDDHGVLWVSKDNGMWQKMFTLETDNEPYRVVVRNNVIIVIGPRITLLNTNDMHFQEVIVESDSIIKLFAKNPLYWHHVAVDGNLFFLSEYGKHMLLSPHACKYKLFDITRERLDSSRNIEYIAEKKRRIKTDICINEEMDNDLHNLLDYVDLYC